VVLSSKTFAGQLRNGKTHQCASHQQRFRKRQFIEFTAGLRGVTDMSKTEYLLGKFDLDPSATLKREIPAEAAALFAQGDRTGDTRSLGS
jgi:hypothetical protein